MVFTVTPLLRDWRSTRPLQLANGLKQGFFTFSLVDSSIMSDIVFCFNTRTFFLLLPSHFVLCVIFSICTRFFVNVEHALFKVIVVPAVVSCIVLVCGMRCEKSKTAQISHAFTFFDITYQLRLWHRCVAVRVFSHALWVLLVLYASCITDDRVTQFAYYTQCGGLETEVQDTSKF